MFRLIEMCRKYETEEEKVVPFYATSLTPGEEELVKQTTLDEEPINKLTEVSTIYVLCQLHQIKVDC